MTISAEIRDYALEMGVSLVGFAPAWRWAERGEVEPGFRPEAIWPETRTVICLGLPSLLPIVETVESDLYRAQYDIANRILDETAYSLARFLNIRGWPSIPVCRDGYGEQRMLRQIPRAAFSHVWAGFYAGLGTIGWNQTLITPEFGPRHRLASVFTSLELAGDPMLGGDLCTGCRVCARVCPAGVFSDGPRGLAMDKLACARQTFGTLYSHCGFCVKACPVGQDRRLFSGADIGSYHRAHADVARWSMGLFPMLAQGGEQVFGARNGRGSDAPARWPENGRHVGCQETAHITPSGEIPDKANRLGADLVLVLPLASMGNLGPGLTAPTRVWDRTQTLIVLGIRTLGEGSEGVEDLIINQIGYKFAVWLSQWAIASVYLARGPGVSGKFSADRLLSAGGISRPDLKRYRALAVLSELKCQRMYVKFFGDDKLRRNVFVYKGTKKVALTKLKIQEMLAKRYFKTYKYIYKKYNPIYWYKNTIEILKENLTLRACSLGAELVGFAQASATAAGEEAEADPATGAGVALPGWARAFVVLGVPLLLPVMETCPSVWGLEHEKTALIIGRKAVNRLAALLASLGCRAAALDSGGLALAKIAARAGLGSLGRNGRLLNEKYGPRVVVAALVTDVPVGTEEGLAGQGKSSGQLCQNCQNCLSVCPVGAERVGQASCLGYQKGLTADYKNPCGFCLRACPVGLDRQLYRSFDFKSYFDEAKALAAGKQPGGKQSWLRVRSYGSYPLSR